METPIQATGVVGGGLHDRRPAVRDDSGLTANERIACYEVMLKAHADGIIEAADMRPMREAIDDAKRVIADPTTGPRTRARAREALLAAQRLINEAAGQVLQATSQQQPQQHQHAHIHVSTPEQISALEAEGM